MGLRRAPLPAVVVPDEETWLLWGRDVRAGGLLPVDEPGRADLLLMPERVPEGLLAAARGAWVQMPPRRRLETAPSPLGGAPAEAVRAEPADGDDDGHGHDGHGHEHGEGHDMMAITGEPSGDGLVMERIDIEAGPLAAGLPTGLLVAATLDGDVVERCRIEPTLRSEDGAPDPFEATAWAVAERVAEERAAGLRSEPAADLLRVAGIELERAVSHLAWLHRVARLLGWAHLADAVRVVLDPAALTRSRVATEPAGGGAPDAAPVVGALADSARRLAERLEGSRLLARRTQGLGCLTAAEASSRGLAGPAARASGVVVDARAVSDPYLRLGFEPLVERAGDARARTLLRAREAQQALALAAAALDGLDAGRGAVACADGIAVEGPRGPVGVVRATAEPQRAAIRTAGELAAGREWAAALVTIASFDLSPWQVAG